MVTLIANETARPRTAPGGKTGGREQESAEHLLTRLQDLPEESEAAASIREQVARAYAPVVRREAARYRNRGEPYEDLQQVASLGLMKAIAGFDPGYGKPFVSYLLPMVTGELKRYFRDNTWAVRVPRKHQEMRSELNRVTLELSQRLGRDPRTSEIAEAMGLNQAEASELMQTSRAYSALSLDRPQQDEEGQDTTMADALGSFDRELEGVADRVALKEAIARLPQRERRILLLRFFGNKTQSDIASIVGLSQMHVSRLLNGTLSRLRADLLGEQES